jgi:hypothetical protein
LKNSLIYKRATKSAFLSYRKQVEQLNLNDKQACLFL